eukprot:gene17199-biopygen3843
MLCGPPTTDRPRSALPPSLASCPHSGPLPPPFCPSFFSSAVRCPTPCALHGARVRVRARWLAFSRARGGGTRGPLTNFSIREVDPPCAAGVCTLPCPREISGHSPLAPAPAGVRPAPPRARAYPHLDGPRRCCAGRRRRTGPAPPSRVHASPHTRTHTRAPCNAHGVGQGTDARGT